MPQTWQQALTAVTILMGIAVVAILAQELTGLSFAKYVIVGIGWRYLYAPYLVQCT
jgi:hypothetical protein